MDYQTEDVTAIGGIDYFPVQGTLTFNDYEMSKTILIPVIPDGGLCLSNRDFAVLLSNPRLDALESTDVSPPRVDDVFGAALVRILDTDIDPILDNNFDTNMMFSCPSNTVFNFAKAHYRVPEDVNDSHSAPVEIFVVRGGTNTAGATLHYTINNSLGGRFDNGFEERNNVFPLQASSDYASPTPPNAGAHNSHSSDFNLVEGTITFAQGQPFAAIDFTITNDSIVEFNEDFHIFLYEDVNGRARPVGMASEATITILFDDQDDRAGSVDQLHNADFGVDMAPPVATFPSQIARPGADGVIYSLLVQPDDKTLIAGDFSSYNTEAKNRIVRMNLDGSADTSFNPGDGPNNFISSLALTPGGQIIIGGNFSFFNGTQRNGVARLTSSGSLDLAFSPGLGADGTVWSVAVQPDGKVLIAGEFTSFDGTPRAHIARLNTDGSLDVSFNPTNGPNGTINAMVLTPTGQVLIGGEFSSVGGQSRNNIARLNPNGTLDTNFAPGLGTDGPVYALALQPDGKLLVGGEFMRYNVNAVRRLARINPDGSNDPSLDVGVGADDTVYAISPQANGTIYVGGLFTSFNGTRRAGLTRLYADGTVDTGFLDTSYNQFAGLPRSYFDSPVDPKAFVFSTQVQSDGKVMIGGGFTEVGGGQYNFHIQLSVDPTTGLTNQDEWPEPKARNGIRNRSNVARLLGGSTPGPGNLGLLYNTYSVNRSQSYLFVNLMRTNGFLGHATANFMVPPGLAQSGTDYTYYANEPIYLSSWTLSRQHSEGLFSTNTTPFDSFGVQFIGETSIQVIVNVPNNTIAGNRDALFQMSNPGGADKFYLGGENIPLGVALGRSSAPFTIIDDNHKPGVLGFLSDSFTVDESTNATITVIRTNGSFGNVSVHFATSNLTATAGVDYRATNGTMTFLGGQTSKTFTVSIIQNGNIQPVDRTLNLRLSSPGGGASIGLSNAVLSIVDDDFPLGFVNFTSTNYFTNESAGSVTLTLTRTGGKKGTVTVQCGTTNGTALNGTDFVGLTNTLQWNDGDSSPRYFTVPLIHDNMVGTNKTFYVRLFNPTGNGTNSPNILGGARTSASVTIIDDDNYGNLQFSAPTYLVNEDGGYATITVTRAAGAAQTLTVHFATADGGAVSSGVLPNFVATNGTLTFGPGDLTRSFTVPILNDNVVDPPTSNFFFYVTLSSLTPAGAVFGSPTVAQVFILDAQAYNQPPGSADTGFSPIPGINGDIYGLALQPDGKILVGGLFTVVNSNSRNRIARLNPDSSTDTTFLSGLSGANGAVRAVLVQSDGRVLTAGSFTTMNGINRNRLARLASDGILDTSFNIGSGADNTIFALAETFVGGNRQILIGGSFTTVIGAPHPGLARMNNDGSLDASFNPALSINGTVFAIAVYPTNSIFAGKILIGGDFTTVNAQGRNRIARLNADGTLDATFDPGTGANDVVRALTLQLDNRVLAGGAFTNFNGLPLNRIVRLNTDGSIDGSFSAGAGADDTVDTIALQSDNRILLAGQFIHANGVSRNSITRLLPDGAVDPSINFGSGANAFIDALAVQADGHIVIGGGFTEYDGQSRQHLARIYGGAIVGSGTLEFTTGDFQADENSTNAVVTVRRRGGTSGPLPNGSGNITVDFMTSAGTAVPGVNYSNVVATLVFPPGETLQSVTVPVKDDFQITPDLTVNLTLSNVLAPAGLGNQPSATLTIINDDSGIRFSSATYVRNEDAIDGVATINVIRLGSARGPAAIDFMTTTNGTAVPGVNFTPVATTLTFQPGDTNLSVRVPIFRVPTAQGDTTVIMTLSNVVNSLLFAPSVATLTIIDVDQVPGQLAFSQTNYVISEAAGVLPVTVIRTNGRSGTVSVSYTTVPGTALPGVKYDTTSGTLTFLNGEFIKVFNVPIRQETQVEGNQTFSLVLSNATGGATLIAPTNVPVTILDDDIGVGFASPIYVTPDTNGTVSVTVLRQNGTNATTSVNYATTNITAQAGTNYVAASGTLTFGPGETIKSFPLQTLRDTRVTGDLTFGVNLSNPTPPAQLINPPSTTVIILDSDAGFAFSNANYSVFKSGTNVLISVLRSNANTGTVSVNFATSNDTAIAGVDYVATNGFLTFSNGITLQSFIVPIINNRLVEGDRDFLVYLINPSAGAQLVPPSTTMITITDDIAGLRFSAPAYSVNENGGLATITVLRTNYTNSTVSVNYATADGSAHAGDNYLPTSGTLTFTNGETAKTFTVTIKDNSVIDGDKTVILNLSTPQGNGVTIDPLSATLTIIETDGSLIVPAGTALTSETGPINGVIDPGERVSLLFALRNSSGTNTVNLVATLLNTNGVSLPSSAQTYGALAVRGPSVSRPFTFTANGTNGQIIIATFHLQDGASDLGLASFNFTLGQNTTYYSNTALIVISDLSAATPYPSVINISGVPGSIAKATASLTNFNHTSPSDVDILLVSPTGQKSFLMAKCGGGATAQNKTFLFDDAAGTSLPQAPPLNSGTFKPTSYAPAPPPFPLPAPPGPYATNLSVFNGSSPNGAWSLYVYDDTGFDSGAISNGWTLNLTTAVLVPGTADVGITMTGSQSIVVTGNTLTNTLTVTNYGPASATNVVITDTLPAGAAFVSALGSLGTTSTNGAGLFTWTINSLAKDAGAVLTLVMRPAIAGAITNSATVATTTIDPNPDDNTATVATTVIVPSADLVLSLVGSPNPIFVGNNLTYTLTITNLGPAVAPTLTLTNTLPPGVSFVSATPSSYRLTGNTVAFTNLGNLGVGAQTGATIVVRPNAAGTITNSAVCASSVIDPLKGNNSASVKTIVEALQLSASQVGAGLVISWTTEAVGYSLESANSLNPPVVWTPVTNTVTSANGQNTVTNAIGSGSRFFRLRRTIP